MNKPKGYPPKEVKERAVRMVFDHEAEYDSQWAAITSVSTKLGMTPETLRKWVRQVETEEGRRPGTTSEKARGERAPARQ